MRVVRLSAADQSGRIVLGRRGENGMTQIVFDVSPFIGTFGQGTAQLAATLPGSDTPYPVAAVREGDAVVWTVSNADTQAKGRGECELFWFVGGALAKSAVFTTVIVRDIGDVGEDPPEPCETWVEQVLAAGAAAQAVANMGVAARTLPAGADATASYEDGVMSLGIPKGDKGDPGEDAVTYVLEPSANAVVYDPNAAAGSRLTPSSITFHAYKITGATKTAFTADMMRFGTKYSYGTSYTQHEENVSSATFDLPARLVPGQEVAAKMESGSVFFDNEVIVKITIPVVSSGVNGQDGAAGSAGPQGPAGPGVPSGGAAGQFLVKQSAADYDAAWVTLQAWQGGSY